MRSPVPPLMITLEIIITTTHTFHSNSSKGYNLLRQANIRSSCIKAKLWLIFIIPLESVLVQNEKMAPCYIFHCCLCKHKPFLLRREHGVIIKNISGGCGIRRRDTSLKIKIQ
jgi:hypothetical protein